MLLSAGTFRRRLLKPWHPGQRLAHDDAGNMIYDGRYNFVYDAWSRLRLVKRAYPSATAPGFTATQTVGLFDYDGPGRRERL